MHNVIVIFETLAQARSRVNAGLLCGHTGTLPVVAVAVLMQPIPTSQLLQVLVVTQMLPTLVQPVLAHAQRLRWSRYGVLRI